MMFSSSLPIRAPRRPASALIWLGLARLGIDLPRPATVAAAVPAALGATDAELARLAGYPVMSREDRVRWNAVAPFYGGRRLWA